jgi:fermentation-respiration switch protein FrsA (DUF1100 family)
MGGVRQALFHEGKSRISQSPELLHLARQLGQARHRTPGMKSIILIALVLYVAVVGLLYFFQRGLMYFPDRVRTSPEAAGFPLATEQTLTTEDGERVLIWHVPPRGERPVVIYFQGNGGGLNLRVTRFQSLVADGTGLIALSYRGYGGSSGSPSEEGLIADARAAYKFAVEHYVPSRLVLWGESLGTGVAVALAAQRPVGKVVLQSPFTSTADVGAAAYWFAPVRLLMKDQFRSDERIGRVSAPVLVMHGERDRVVPFRFGERLFSLVKSDKRFVRFADGGHDSLDALGALAEVKKFIGEK